MNTSQSPLPGQGETHLHARCLAKTYRGYPAVRDVSLHIKSGEIVGLLGPNGAGKTTSFYMLVGLVRPDAGEVRLNGQDITQLPMHKRAQMGLAYLPQDASIFRKLRVDENILAILELQPKLTSAGRQQRLAELLAQFNIAHLAAQFGAQLSGGERRRVEIARALAIEPTFILLDEPFAGIDPVSVLDIQQVVRQLAKRGLGVLITDHNVRETLNLCDRATVVHAGKVIAEGKPAAILQNEAVRKVYLGNEFDL